jgi:UDP-glucose 4-epimerase
MINSSTKQKPTRWLITGGCGFIGTNLIKNLLSQRAHSIRIVDNLSVGKREDLAQLCKFTELNDILKDRSAPLSVPSTHCELVVADILDADLSIKANQGIDVIVHLAASTGVAPSVEDPRQDMEANVIGTVNYLEGARKNSVDKFIFASSGAPIGECEPPIHEEMPPHPVSPYGASKLAGEAYCSAYYRTFGIKTIVLRFGNVYGPGSSHKNSVVAKFIRQAMRGETLKIYGDGKQTRDFIYIDDLIQAIHLAASVEGIGGEIFQIATNDETTVNELVEKLLPIFKKKGIKNVKIQHISPRLGDVKRNFSVTSKARRLLNWKPQVNLRDGLQRTVDWFYHYKAQGIQGYV